MVDMKSIKLTAAERKAREKADAAPYDAGKEDRGVRMELEHEHLQKLGLAGALSSGDKVRTAGEGSVETAESRMVNGEPRHRATIRLHKLGVELKSPHGDEDERDSLRNDIERAHGEKARGRDERSEDRDAATARTGKKFSDK